jgi:hypothetical protein
MAFLAIALRADAFASPKIAPGDFETRAVLALALWARCARPKSLPAILSSSSEFVHAPRTSKI